MKTKFNRIGIVGLLAACILVTGAGFAAIVNGLFNNPNNIAHVSYNNDNYLGSGAFVFGDDTITGDYSITLSGYNMTLICHEQLVGYYENPFWGSDRIWPLDTGTLQTLSSSVDDFANVSMTGGFFTSCTNENIDPYAIFGYLEYSYYSPETIAKETGYKIWAGVSGLNSNNPVFENSLFLLGGGSGYDLSASGWIFDSVSYTGIVTPSTSGDYSVHKPVVLGGDTPGFNFVHNSPSFKSGNVWYTTGQNINVKMHGVTGYHWHLSGDLTNNKSGIFGSSDIETGITLTSGTGIKTVKFSVFVDDDNVYSGDYQITLISENEGSGGTPNTESGSVSCSWSGPIPLTILTGETTTFTLSCIGSSDMVENFQNKVEIIHYNGGFTDIEYYNLANISVIFTAGNSTGTDVRLRLKSGAVCLQDDLTICNEIAVSETFTITGSNVSGGDNPGPGTQSGQAPTIDIVTQPSPDWSINKTIKAASDNFSGFQYIVTSSDVCNLTTQFSNPIPYVGNSIVRSDESDNNKYICFRAWNNYGTGYARSNIITKIDRTNPICTWGEPSEIELYVGETGSITLTCVDTGAGIENTSLSNSNLSATYGVLSFSNATVSGDPSSKSFSFVYTALNTGETTISILGNRINDNAGNSNDNAESLEITVIDQDNPGHGSASCERLFQFTEVPHSSWTQSDTVEVELLCGSTGWWDFSNVNVGVDIWDGTGFENGHLLLTTTGESFNGKYVCVYAQSGDRVETGCTEYPFKVDAFPPIVQQISPSNGANYESGDTVSLSWSGHDLTSGISGYLLTIDKPNSETIIGYFDSGTTSTGIIVDSAGRWYRNIKGFDNAGRVSEISTRYFNVTYSGGNNSGGSNNSGGNNTGSNETGETITGFNLISPALFDRLSLGNDVIFKWDSGEINSGYRLTVEKVGGDTIYSGFTTGISITLNHGYFTTGAYSWSVEDIATNTIETIPLFYVVDAQYLPDLKINQFEFDEIRNADIDEYYKSDEVTIDGLEDGWYTFAYLQDSIGALYINGDFVGTQGFVTNGDIIRIELKSSHENSTTVSTTLIIGAGANLVSGDFKVTTRDGINGWDDPLLTPLQKLWGTIFVDSLVEMYQNNPEKLATFLSTFMQLLQDKSDYYAQEILNAQLSGDNELANEYRTYKNAIDFLYTIVKYRYDNLNVEDRTVYIAPNGKQYLVEYNEDRMAYTSPDFARPKYFPTRELFTNHIDMNNPAVGKWGIVGNVITTHNGKVYTIYETNGKWTSSNFKTAKYFDTKEDIINHILANNPASDWNHTVDPDFDQVTYTAPNGKVYKIFKTSSKGNNPNMYSSYNFVNAKYFTSLEAAKKFIDQDNKK